MVVKGKLLVGPILALIWGILGIVGALVPLGTITIVTPIPIIFTGSFLLLDSILMIHGGILGLTLKE